MNPKKPQSAPQEPQSPPSAEPQSADSRHVAHLSVEELIEQANPKPTADQSLALRLSSELEVEAKREVETARRIRNLSALFYLACIACGKPALFFTRDPGTDKVMRHGEWFSALKPMGRPWPSGKLRCQHCNARARAAYVAGHESFVPAARFVRSLPKSRPGVSEIIEQIEAFTSSQKGGVA